MCYTTQSNGWTWMDYVTSGLGDQNDRAVRSSQMYNSKAGESGRKMHAYELKTELGIVTEFIMTKAAWTERNRWMT